MRNKHAYESGFSSIATTAVLSVALLLTVILWQTNATLSAKNRALHAIAQYAYTDNQSGAENPETVGTENAPESASVQDPNDLSRIGTNPFRQLLNHYPYT